MTQSVARLQRLRDDTLLLELELLEEGVHKFGDGSTLVLALDVPAHLQGFPVAVGLLDQRLQHHVANVVLGFLTQALNALDVLALLNLDGLSHLVHEAGLFLLLLDLLLFGLVSCASLLGLCHLGRFLF